MFMLGVYYEDEAKDVADYLKDAGMKVDIKTFTVSNVETSYFLEGRMSELFAILTEEEKQEYGRYLAALRKVLADGAKEDDWGERLAGEIDPNREENREKLLQMLSEHNQKDEQIEAGPQVQAAGVEEQSPIGEQDAPGESNQSGQAEPSGEQRPSEDVDQAKDEQSRIFKTILDVANAKSFAELVLERNNFPWGEDGAALPDDPILRVSDESEDEESELSRTTSTFSVEPRAMILVDEYYSVLVDELDDDFRDEYPKEYSRLIFLAKIIGSLEEPSQDKEDMDSFCERSQMKKEIEGNILELDASEAVEVLARSMEKNGVIKIKGDRIKWKH